MSFIDTIKRVVREYHERIASLEDEKFDLEYCVKRKDIEVQRPAKRAVLYRRTETYFLPLTIVLSRAVLSLLSSVLTRWEPLSAGVRPTRSCLV